NEGDELEIGFSEGIIKNLTQKTEYKFEPIPEFMQELVRSGGLINYAKKSL
ncbi:3-isopropylmalate dehydratase, partial [Campylobacter hyointestinalis subsp. lawsonii]